MNSIAFGFLLIFMESIKNLTEHIFELPEIGFETELNAHRSLF